MENMGILAPLAKVSVAVGILVIIIIMLILGRTSRPQSTAREKDHSKDRNGANIANPLFKVTLRT